MQILIPKRRMRISVLGNGDVSRPLYFLLGPIRGGGDWQHAMCLALKEHNITPDCVIACPCRWDEEHPLAGYFLDGYDDGYFPRQLNWERHYLQMAGVERRPGCIVSMLPCESKEEPHPGPEPYAMDTRGELGEWRWRVKTERARLVIGAEEGFLGLSQIKRNFDLALGHEFPVYRSIEETARAASLIAFT